MLRISSAVAVALTVACAVVLYTVSYDTRELDHSVQDQERRIERLRSDIAVLRAERAYLSRPERIEPLARAIGMVPAQGEQYVDMGSLPVGGSQRAGGPGEGPDASSNHAEGK